MEFRHLRYFVTLAEEGHFTRAAQRLHIAQPSLSRQISQLEESLGVALFDRHERPLLLTEAGRFFYAHAQRLLTECRALESMTRRIGQAQQELAIAFVGSTLYDFVPDIIRRFRLLHPGIALTLHELATADQIIAIKEGRIDLGFGRLHHSDPNVRQMVLRQEPLSVALPRDHPLTAHTAIAPETLLSETLLAFPASPAKGFITPILSALRERGIVPKKIVEVQELQVAIGLVAAAEGIAIVPRSVEGLNRADICYRPLADTTLSSPVMLNLRHGEPSPEISLLIDMANGR